MKKAEILKQVAEVMHNDAACCKDKKDDYFPKYELLIKEEMSDNNFLLTVNSYLSMFGLTGHLFFKKQGHKCLPFRVHRYGDALYVTDITKDSLLGVGDRIIEINGDSVNEFYEKHAESFFGEPPERQTPHWNHILKYAEQIGYIRKSEDVVQHWNIKLYDWKGEQSPYIFKKITPLITYLKFSDFMNATEISALLEINDFELRTTKNLIIDVRGNEGGNSYSYYPLLKYCLPRGKKLKELDLMDSDVFGSGQEILYSARNCDVRLEIIEELMKENCSERDKDILGHAIEKLRELRGKGFVKEIDDYDNEIIGDSDVENVVILTDSCCCSAGDAFVNLFKMLPKVKVVGRPTQGILDYSNVAYALFDEYALVYPTSRLISLDYGKRMMGKGVSVDNYIPWTPEHLKRDVDLEYVLKNIFGQT